MEAARNFRRRTYQNALEAVGRAPGKTTDPVMEAHAESYRAMSKETDELGAGIAAQLHAIKSLFHVTRDLAAVIPKFYDNGAYVHDWGEEAAHPFHTEPILCSGEGARDYERTWVELDEVVRRANTLTVMEKTLDPLRAYVADCIPLLRRVVRTRDAARADLDSYQRQKTAAKEGPDRVRIQAKLDKAKIHFEEVNASAKSELEQAKLAHDELIEMSFATLLAGQAELFTSAAAKLNAAAERVGAGGERMGNRITSTRAAIRAREAAGGPAVVHDEKMSNPMFKVVTGQATMAEVSEPSSVEARTARHAREKEARDRGVELDAERKKLHAGQPATSGVQPKAKAAPPPPPRALKKPPAPLALECRVATFDCNADGADELSFAIGDVIECLSTDEASGWGKGRVKGTSGGHRDFPLNYTKPEGR